MEKYELVDKEGKSTGKILTQEQLGNIPEGHYLPVVGVVIINDKKEVLLQKRSKSKRINPNKWGICGGKINFGENAIEAGIRETIEEIFVRLSKEEFKFLT
jgi:8-oxo-dGTP pyrophosphatase MutT (NUDIX family)